MDNDLIPAVSGMEAIDDDKQEMSASFDIVDKLGEIIQEDVQKLRDCSTYMGGGIDKETGIAGPNHLQHPGTLKTYLECVNLITKTTKELIQIKKQAKGKGSGIDGLLEDLGID